MLDRGILAVFDQMVWDHDGFAVASGYDEATGKYVGLAIPQENVPPQITDSTLLVRPDRAIAQREQERAEQEAARAAAAAAAGAAGTGAATVQARTPVPPPPGRAAPPQAAARSRDR